MEEKHAVTWRFSVRWRKTAHRRWMSMFNYSNNRNWKRHPEMKRIKTGVGVREDCGFHIPKSDLFFYKFSLTAHLNARKCWNQWMCGSAWVCSHCESSRKQARWCGFYHTYICSSLILARFIKHLLIFVHVPTYLSNELFYAVPSRVLFHKFASWTMNCKHPFCTILPSTAKIYFSNFYPNIDPGEVL